MLVLFFFYFFFKSYKRFSSLFPKEIFRSHVTKAIYFIPSSESSAYLKQIKCILSPVKRYRIFSLVTDTIFIFSL